MIVTNVMWYVGSQSGSPLTQEDARETVEPVRTDDAGAEWQHAPDWNEVETDSSPQLLGLSPRLKGSDTIDSVKSVPWWTALASNDYESVIDRQVSSSGHGTMQYAIGIEPVIRDGAAFGNDYFVSHDRDIQDGAGSYMTPDPNGDWLNVVAAANARKASRQAYQASLYKNLWD
jgi:hypothetical protein